MAEKVQVSMYLKKELKHIIENEDLNLTKFVNDALETYFSVSSVEDLDVKLVKIREQVKILEKKRADLVGSGVAETRTDAISTILLEDIKRFFIARRNQDPSGETDEAWIRSPRMLERCKKIGMDPLEVLKEIKEWYNDVQKDHS